MTNFTNDQLFNMTPGGVAPDWSTYSCLEIGGCINDRPGEDDTEIIGNIPQDEAEFFTVYGRMHPCEDMGVACVEAITDCRDFETAQEIAALFSGWSHLPVHVEC